MVRRWYWAGEGTGLWCPPPLNSLPLVRSPPAGETASRRCSWRSLRVTQGVATNTGALHTGPQRAPVPPTPGRNEHRCPPHRYARSTGATPTGPPRAPAKSRPSCREGRPRARARGREGERLSAMTPPNPLRQTEESPSHSAGAFEVPRTGATEHGCGSSRAQGGSANLVRQTEESPSHSAGAFEVPRTGATEHGCGSSRAQGGSATRVRRRKKAKPRPQGDGRGFLQVPRTGATEHGCGSSRAQGGSANRVRQTEESPSHSAGAFEVPRTGFEPTGKTQGKTSRRAVTR